VPIQIRDVLSFSGRDYVVEGTATYRVAGKVQVFARALDGDIVAWFESPLDGEGAGAERLLVLHEIRDLDLTVPPPDSISYHRLTYVQRLHARAIVDTSGDVPERSDGAVQLWRYRAAGDLTLQIEEGSGRVFMLAGETVHRGMIEHLPGKPGGESGR
jgi:hypothetical protein